MSFEEFHKAYGTVEQCEEALVQSRWPQGYCCPRCNGKCAALTHNGRRLWGRQGISKLSYAKGLAIDIHQLTQCDPSPTAKYAEENYHRPLCLGF